MSIYKTATTEYETLSWPAKTKMKAKPVIID